MHIHSKQLQNGWIVRTMVAAVTKRFGSFSSFCLFTEFVLLQSQAPSVTSPVLVLTDSCSEMQVRRAEFDDCKDLSDLIMQTGGVSIYKATFGTYNLSSMIENSYLSIMSSHKNQTGEDDEVRSTVSFMSINDGLSVISTDPDAYNKVMHTISHYIPATVR